jgi:hypothetical protein
MAPSMIRSSSISTIGKQVGLVSALVMAIWLVSDESWNVATAMQKHEPSARIFRSLLQVNLGFWCVAVSLAVYQRIVSRAVVEELLFCNDEPSIMNDDTIQDNEEDNDDEHQSTTSSLRRIFVKTKNSYRRAAYRGVEAVKMEQHPFPLHNESDLTFAESTCTTENHENIFNKSLETTIKDDERDEADYDSNDGFMRAYTALGSNVPSPESMVRAALDNLMIILVALFLFTITATGYMQQQDEQMQQQDEFESNSTLSETAVDSSSSSRSVWNLVSRIAAPTFPLLLIIYLSIRSVSPWRRQRQRLWSVVARTLWAPIPSPVTFRDGFIGDILTSSVRPLQDLAFTFCYLLFGLKGWWSTAYYYYQMDKQGAHGAGGVDYSFGNTTTHDEQSFSLIHQADARIPEMDKSWIVHTVILPTCMISPLWWRFLQNLRQSYDYKARWPYLGNALKYFVAAQVAMFGIYHPDQRNSALWIVSFVIATLYQVWWDIFMDWGLFQRNKQGRWELRPKRLYATTMVYWIICFINISLRFCWILTFLPPRYLDAAGRLTENFGEGLGAVFGPSLASAEIIRRSLWGLLRFEWEAIKEMPEKGEALSAVSHDGFEQEHADDEGLEMPTTSRISEMTPMDMKRDDEMNMTQLSLQTPWWKSDMSSMNDVQILSELCMYATVFLIIGALAAAHRETL